MDISKVRRWVNFITSELSLHELEEFEKLLKKFLEEKFLEEKNRILFEQPLTINPRKFRGIKIEDSELTLRTQRLLLSKKYKTLEQVAKLSRNQVFELIKYGFRRKQICEIIDYLADDKTPVSRDLYDSIVEEQAMEEFMELVKS